jgi:tetratricopeptide (TPR) repeat protein
MKKVKVAFNKIFEAFKTNLISWFVVVLTIFSIFKGLEFFAIICLVFLWIRNDSEMGIRLRQVFEQIGKEGVKFRKPPEETVSAEKPSLTPQITDQAEDFKLFNKANTLLSKGDLLEAEKQYLNLAEKTSNHRIKTDSFLNLGVTYMRLWHQTYNQEYLDKSIESSRKALELDPEGYRSRLNLAVALSKNRRTESEALKYFEEADERGDLRDPVLWGKIKLFKASLILTLTGRIDGAKYKDRIFEAELDMLEALRLFEMMKNHPEIPWLNDEAKTSLNLIKKKTEALFANHRIHKDAR